MPYHQSVTGPHLVEPEPDFWLSLLTAVIGLGLIAWSLHDEWRKKRRDQQPPDDHN